MKTLREWFDEYSVSHQNMTNKKIHYVCVPLIFFSVVGMIMSIPSKLLIPLEKIHPILGNWAFIAMILVSLFYFKLSFSMGIKMFVFTFICLVVNYWLALLVPVFWFSLSVFVIGWIGQFYGHKIEGEKPSFLKDLQFLLIGPAWVIHSVFNGK
ncbi:Mpo1 family 2-hydroxy fatty acid dioxygenase [Flavobacterium sp.]|uniref:Mpo1 family 2-hydroxy fatty acid dioxygenase n=2 Tax=Flavobacterium sp. TaxID=239 RepID=UPI0040475312